MENKDKNQIINMAVGYDKQEMEMAISLLNSIPARTFVETQAKLRLFEILMNPQYEFEPPVQEN